MRPPVGDDEAELAESSPAGSHSEEDVQADEADACVGYVFSEKKRGSLLTPEFLERARCALARRGAARAPGAGSA